MSVICARLGSKGKVGVQRGRETAGVPSFLPSAVGAARSRRPQTANLPAEVQRKTPRPSGSNTLTQFAHPGFPVQKRSRPSGATPPAAVRVPRSAGAAKGAARQGRTRLRQFVCPGQPAQKRSRTDRANPPAAVRMPRSAGAAKGTARQGRTRLRQFVCPGHLVQRKEKHRRIASTVLKVCTFTQIAAAYRHPYAPAPAGPVPDDRAR